MYLLARREPANNFLLNGEIDLLAAVLANLGKLEGRANHEVFDIGANVGEWTKYALAFMDDRNGTADVIFHVFEPIPQTFQRLQKNLEKGIAAGRVVANQSGVAQFPGSAVFRSSVEHHGTNSIMPDESSLTMSPESILTVSMTSIDEYSAAKRIDRISVVKIDTEGNDFNVLLGAEKMMTAERIDVLQFEYNHRWIFFRRFLKDVFDFIEGRPYHLGKLSKGRIELIPAWHPELERYFETNFVIAHRRTLSWLPVYRGSFDATNSYA